MHSLIGRSSSPGRPVVAHGRTPQASAASQRGSWFCPAAFGFRTPPRCTVLVVSGINWGDVPTWLAVVVASVGGGIALRQLRLQGAVIKGEIERNAARDKLLDGQLKELAARVTSGQRQQAEHIDLTWENIQSAPSESLAVVINGSRRPIRNVSCVAWVGDPKERLVSRYAAEMRPIDFPRQAFAMPEQTPDSWMTIYALRAGGRAGFRFATEVSDDDETEVEFTDDAGCRWSLTSGLHLSLLESPAAQHH